MLGRRGHPGRPHSLDRGAGARRDAAGVAGEGAEAHHRGRAAGHVGDRRQVHVHAGASQLAAAGASALADRLRSALRGLSGGRAGPAHGADLTALLVCHDEGLAARLALHRSGQTSPLVRRARVEAEQDHPGGLTGPQASADVVGRCRVREARDDQLADLLAKAQAVDGCEQPPLLLVLSRFVGRGLRRLFVAASRPDGEAGYEGRQAGGQEQG